MGQVVLVVGDAEPDAVHIEAFHQVQDGVVFRRVVDVDEVGGKRAPIQRPFRAQLFERGLDAGHVIVTRFRLAEVVEMDAFQFHAGFGGVGAVGARVTVQTQGGRITAFGLKAGGHLHDGGQGGSTGSGRVPVGAGPVQVARGDLGVVKFEEKVCGILCPGLVFPECTGPGEVSTVLVDGQPLSRRERDRGSREVIQFIQVGKSGGRVVDHLTVVVDLVEVIHVPRNQMLGGAEGVGVHDPVQIGVRSQPGVVAHVAPLAFTKGCIGAVRDAQPKPFRSVLGGLEKTENFAVLRARFNLDEMPANAVPALVTGVLQRPGVVGRGAVIVGLAGH